MSESYEIEGTIKQVGEAQQFGQTFVKREFVLTVDDGKYPQDVSFEFHGEGNIGKLDDVGQGITAKVSFNIRGRYHEGSDRHYNTLVAWKIQLGEVPASEPLPPTLPQQKPDIEDEEDELLF